MIFEKDPKTRYVDMAIYIDEHIHSEDFDPELVYKYLYFLVYMLASKKKYFTKISDYEDFSLWCASRVYLILTNPKPETPSGRNKPIKSILNWLKHSIYFLLCYYRKENFQETIQGDLYTLGDYYSDSLNFQNNIIIKQQMFDSFEQIPSMIKFELDKSPYVNNKVYYNNLYISCLINFIYSITLPSSLNDKLNKKLQTDLNIDISNFEGLNEEYFKTWDLPSEFYPFIKLTLNKVKKKLIDNIKDIISLRYTKDMKHDIILSEYGDVSLGSSKPEN